MKIQLSKKEILHCVNVKDDATLLKFVDNLSENMSWIGPRGENKWSRQ